MPACLLAIRSRGRPCAPSTRRSPRASGQAAGLGRALGLDALVQTAVTNGNRFAGLILQCYFSLHRHCVIILLIQRIVRFNNTNCYIILMS